LRKPFNRPCLIKAKSWDEARKRAMIAVQGITVLQNVYVWQNNQHLLAYENKQKKKGEKN
jgi:hypothetical protein